jgi:hypothetical protein
MPWRLLIPSSHATLTLSVTLKPLHNAFATSTRIIPSSDDTVHGFLVEDVRVLWTHSKDVLDAMRDDLWAVGDDIVDRFEEEMQAACCLLLRRLGVLPRGDPVYLCGEARGVGCHCRCR